MTLSQSGNLAHFLLVFRATSYAIRSPNRPRRCRSVPLPCVRINGKVSPATYKGLGRMILVGVLMADQLAKVAVVQNPARGRISPASPRSAVRPLNVVPHVCPHDGGVIYSIDLWILVSDHDQSGRRSMAVSPGSRGMP
jgi:hypothetical protein